MVDEYDESTHWSKAKVAELARRLNLKESQIYKWNWDHSLTLQRRFEKTLRKLTCIREVESISDSEWYSGDKLCLNI